MPRRYCVWMATVQITEDVVLISIKSERQSDISRHFAIPLRDIAEIKTVLSQADRAEFAQQLSDARCVSDARDADNAVIIRLKRGSTRTFVLDLKSADAVQRLMTCLN